MAERVLTAISAGGHAVEVDLERLEGRASDNAPAVLVIGGGAAGLSAALSLAGLGRPVVLVERSERTGGRATGIDDLITRAGQDETIEVLAPAGLAALDGHAGRFRAVIAPRTGDKVVREVGTVIAATGAAWPPPGQTGPVTGYAGFDDMLRSGSTERLPASVGFLADPEQVGEVLSRHAMDDACLVRERQRQAYVFLGNVPVRGREGQALYERALEAGVTFFRTHGRRADVKVEDGRAAVRGEDAILGRPFEIRVDLLVSGRPPGPSAGTLEVAGTLGLDLEDGGFPVPRNMTFLPARTAREGVLAAGSCVGDMGTTDAMLSGRSAALQAHEILERDLATVTPGDVAIDTRRCVACLTCLRICPWSAVGIDEKGHYPVISDTDCHDCGICAAACPQRTITNRVLAEEAILELGRACLETRPAGGPITLALCCERSGLAAAEAAGSLGLEMPEDVHIVNVGCAGTVSTNLIMDLLLADMSRVLVFGCPEENCQNRRGSTVAAHRVGLCRDLLSAMGADPSRVAFHAVASNMPHLFVQRIS